MRFAHLCDLCDRSHLRGKVGSELVDDRRELTPRSLNILHDGLSVGACVRLNERRPEGRCGGRGEGGREGKCELG